MIHHIRDKYGTVLLKAVISGQASEETTTFINYVVHMKTNTLSE